MLSSGDARRGEVAQVAVPLDDHAGERGADLGVRQVVLGGLQRPPGLLDGLLLDLDQQLDLADLVVADLREVDALGRLLLRLLRGSSALRATSIWVREARALASRASARSTCADAESRDCVTCCCRRCGLAPCCSSRVKRAYSSSASVREACAAFDSGSGLVDALLDSSSVSTRATPRPWPGRPAAAAAVRRAISIWIGTSLRTRSRSARWRVSSACAGVELGPRDVDLVAVRDRVDLRDDLALGDAVVLVDQEPDDPAGDQLRGDVDDVGLDEGVVGDRVSPPVLDPAHRRAAGRRR